MLFADLSGFTSLGEQLDPEELTSVVHESLGELMQEVRSQEGGLVRQIGDAIMAVFGAPETHEDDPVRAVRAALAMQQRMSDINGRLSARLERPLELHVGINTGLVVMDRSIEGAGQALDSAFTVLGDAVNVASRLQDVAGPGQVVVGEATRAATDWAFQYRPLPPVLLRGKQEKVYAFECLGARAAPAESRGITRGIASPLRGREDELRSVEVHLAQLAERRGGLLCVVGEPGVGKSRLVAEAKRRGPEDGLLWLEGRSYPLSRTESYRPFAEILRTHAGIAPGEDDATGWEKVHSVVSRLLPQEAADVAPYLATLAGIEVQGPQRERLKYHDGEAMGRQIFRSSRRFFHRLAQERPLVLVFEDWHWADESSEALLEHLLALVETDSLLVWCVTRPDPGTAGERVRRFAEREHADRLTVLELAPLSSPDASLLIDDTLENVSPSARELLLRKTEGNPFFLEECIRSLIDTGLAVPGSPGRWRLTGDLESISIPDTVEGIIMARFQRLDDRAKELLRVASVLGRTFNRDVLTAVVGADHDLDAHFADLVSLELIREKEGGGGGEYTFKHALTHETVYENMLLSRRRELHRLVAEHLEGAHAAHLEDHYGALAYHFARAEEWGKAHEYLMKAGDYAGRMAADTESLAFYREAVRAYSRAFGDRWDPLQRASLERKMGEALFRIGKNSEARELMTHAVRVLGRPFPASPPRVRNAIMRQVLKRAAKPLLPSFWRRPPASLIQRAQELDRIYEVMAWIDYWVDPEKFALECFMRLRVAERTGNKLGIAGGSASLGLMCDHIPLPRLAMQYGRRAVQLAEETGDPAAIGLAYLALGFHFQHSLGRGSEAFDLYQKGVGACWQAGDLRGWGAISWMQSWILRRQGRYAEALERSQEMIRVGEESADLQLYGWGLQSLAKCRWQQGYPEEAIQPLERSANLARAIPDYQALTGALGALGQALLDMGRLQEAVPVLEEAGQSIEQRKLRGPLCTDQRMALAQAHLVMSERSEGAERRQQLRRAESACRAALASAKIDREGAPSAYRHLGTMEWLRGRPRAATRAWRRSISWASETQAPYELARTLIEMGERTGDEVSLLEGKRTLAEIEEGPGVTEGTLDTRNPASRVLPAG